MQLNLSDQQILDAIKPVVRDVLSTQEGRQLIFRAVKEELDVESFRSHLEEAVRQYAASVVGKTHLLGLAAKILTNPNNPVLVNALVREVFESKRVFFQQMLEDRFNRLIQQIDLNSWVDLRLDKMIGSAQRRIEEVVTRETAEIPIRFQRRVRTAIRDLLWDRTDEVLKKILETPQPKRKVRKSESE